MKAGFSFVTENDSSEKDFIFWRATRKLFSEKLSPLEDCLLERLPPPPLEIVLQNITPG